MLHHGDVFVFSSVLIAATWFLSRLAWDRARPDWRMRPDRERRRFVAITATGAMVAVCGFGVAVGLTFGLVAGIWAGVALLPVYCFIAVVLRMLLASFADEDWSAGE